MRGRFSLVTACYVGVLTLAFGLNSLYGAAYEDDWVSIDDASVQVKTVSDRKVYVFTNAAATVTLKQALTLEEALVVGGGGAGGWSVLTPDTDKNNGGSAGGGGGGVVWTNLVTACKAGDALLVAVGAGGDPAELYDETTNPVPAGGNGGASTLTLGGLTVTAYGGGGGAGYNSRYPGKGLLGSGGGFVKVANNDYRFTGDGLYYTSSQGNCGSYTLSAGTGGGGGAGQRMLRGFNDNRGNVGGAGLPVAITGMREVYGSGGGGGYPYRTNGTAGGVGGANAGQGLALSSGRSQHGVDGFGGGGGGSSRIKACQGGRGGCGTVILSFSVGDVSAQKLTIDPIGRWPLKDGVAEPPPVVRCGNTVLTLGTDYTVSYANNTARGYVGIVEVTGIGSYAGRTAHQTFDIALVLYAAQDGSDAADGSSWANATSVSNALILAEADGYREIWLKAGDYPLTAAYVTTKAIAVRGGYAGTDDAQPNKLAASPYSVFDAQDAVGTCFTINQVKTSMPEVEFERCVFQRATAHNLSFASYYGLRLIDCKFLANVKGQSQNGRGLFVDGESRSPATLIDCEIGGNVLCVTTSRDGGGGCGAFFTDVDVWMDGCLFASNGLTAASSEANYPNSNLTGVIFDAPKVRAKNCRFIGNRGASRWGSGSSNGGGLCNVSGNGSSFENCLWLGNSDQSESDMTTYKGGCLYTGSAITMTVSRCTFAYNVQMGKNVSAGITMAAGHVFVKDSIFYGNTKHTSALFGADLGLAASAYATISNSFFGAGAADAATRADYLYAADTTHLVLADDVQYGDPKFVTPVEDFLACLKPRSSGVAGVPTCSKYTTFAANKAADVMAFDVHLLSSGGYYTNDGTFHKDASVTSPAILSDGTNLGCYGGTAEASKLDTIAPAIEGDVTVVWTNNTSQPVISFYLGGNNGAAYNAKVTVRYGVVGNMREVVYPSVAGQQRLTVIGDTCFAKNAAFTVSVSVEAGGATAEGAFAGTVEADYPPNWGKGGGAHVLHVRPDATGRGDGTDWFNALTDFYAALDQVSSGRYEVWLSGNIKVASPPTSFNPPCPAVLRGGFAGVETNAADRVRGAVSTLDGDRAYRPLTLANANAVTLDSLRFFNAPKQGLYKTGAGDLTLTNCEIAVNGKTLSMLSSSAKGYGLYAAGQTDTTTLTVIDTRFVGNGLLYADDWSGYVTPGGTYYRESGDGHGAYVTSFRSVTFDGCLFVTNGVPFNNPVTSYPGGGGSGASALSVVSAPVTVRNCRFVANKGYAHEANGGTVRLGAGTSGSRVANCLFVGNQNTIFTDYNGLVRGGGGEIHIAAGAASDMYEIANCTFALNLTAVSTLSGSGVNVRTGTASVRNCVFDTNLVGRRAASGASDIAVGASGNVQVSYSLFNATNGLYVADGGTLELGHGLVYGRANLVTTFPTYRYAVYASSDGDYLAFDMIPTLLAANCHLRGRLGYVDETTGCRVLEWQYPVSKAVDGGDPLDAYGCEPECAGVSNGRRVNMGFYGNTPWATGSRVRGFFISVGTPSAAVTPQPGPAKPKAKVPDDYDDILVCDQNGQYARIYDGPLAMRGTWQETWRFKMSGNIAECKPFENGTLIGLVDNSGNWRIVDRATTNAVASGKADGSTHSLELLPGDVVATASTDGSHAFQFFNWSGKSIAKYDGFSYPHGLYWDGVSNRLYLASSDGLMRARVGYVDDVYTMTIEKTWVTEDLGLTDAHDLRLVPGTRMLVISTLQKIVFFNLDKGEWLMDRFVYRYNTKSVDASADARSYLLAVPNNVNKSWQTDTLEMLDDGEFKTLPRIANAWIYKARWIPRR